LNALRKLKQFLKFEVSEYENIQVEWVGGHTPTAYFKDEEGAILEEVVLQDFDHDQMVNFFILHGLTPRKPKVEFGEPVLSWNFQGHHYQYYPTQSPFTEAKKFAQSQTYQNQPGYLLTLTTPTEENTLKQKLIEYRNQKIQDGQLTPEQNTPILIWLGAEDDVEESLWKWSQGPDEGTLFFQGKGTQGSKIYPLHSNWFLHEPNNANDYNEEDCAAVVLAISDDIYWNDLPCHQRLGVVVEYGDEVFPNELPGPEPSQQENGDPHVDL